jgi:hypothetical protein
MAMARWSAGSTHKTGASGNPKPDPSHKRGVETPTNADSAARGKSSHRGRIVHAGNQMGGGIGRFLTPRERGERTTLHTMTRRRRQQQQQRQSLGVRGEHMQEIQCKMQEKGPRILYLSLKETQPSELNFKISTHTHREQTWRWNGRLRETQREGERGR